MAFEVQYSSYYFSGYEVKAKTSSVSTIEAIKTGLVLPL